VRREAQARRGSEADGAKVMERIARRERASKWRSHAAHAKRLAQIIFKQVYYIIAVRQRLRMALYISLLRKNERNIMRAMR
jgi:hypothetical protein